MSIFVLKIFLRKLICWIFCGRRRPLILVVLFMSCILVWYYCWWLISIASQAILSPISLEQDLYHYRRSRSIAHYLDNVQILIEPTSTPCAAVEELPVIILVTSAPDNYESRQAIRETWAKYQPTYFVLGLHGNGIDESLVDNYLEAKQYSDMIVFNFRDHYQNLTLKTALMIQWTLSRCPQAQFMLKTDDDVLINPWMLRTVLKENHDAKLLGYQIIDGPVHRYETNKWYVPRWLYSSEVLPQYLAGPGYLLNGEYLQKILNKALEVPMINLEDVYFTYLVANKNLGLKLTNDHRLCPYKPYFSSSCIFRRLASVHGFTPNQIITGWAKIQSGNSIICSLFSFYYNSDLLFY